MNQHEERIARIERWLSVSSDGADLDFKALMKEAALLKSALETVYHTIEHLPQHSRLVDDTIVPALNAGTGTAYDPFA